MTTELVTRVSAWLASRKVNRELERRWLVLMNTWTGQQTSTLADAAEATAAAMGGVLLALVWEHDRLACEAAWDVAALERVIALVQKGARA